MGTLMCDFMRPHEFLDMCKGWLSSSELHHVVTLNPEMVMQAQHDELFRKAASGAALRVPDGAGLIWARWYIRSGFWSLLPSLIAFSFRDVERITGVDAVIDIARLCESESKKLCLIGGTPSQLSDTATLLRHKFPKLVVSTATAIEDVSSSKPVVLFVAYGSPKQTIWIENNKQELEKAGVRIAIGVGGAFAILSEATPRAPILMRKLNLEWLWRLMLEPTRFPRIWNAVVRFPLLIQSQKGKL